MIGSIQLGHAGDPDALTGCTVFLLPQGTVGACEVRGGAPGTRETELLRPKFTARTTDAVLLTGGSAFGLGAAEGVMRFLEERGRGFPTPSGPVPIVSSAVIYDLDIGKPDVRPDASMGYECCLNADIDERREGNVGVGLGASVGNALGRKMSTKGGFGIFAWEKGNFKLEVAAVANGFGDVVGEDGKIMAGTRDEEGNFPGVEDLICSFSKEPDSEGLNTTLVVIATNARLTKEEASRICLQGHNGIARVMRPSHTRYDGDTVFALSTGEVDFPLDAVEVLAAIGTASAIRSGVMKAEAAGGLPSARAILKRKTE